LTDLIVRRTESLYGSIEAPPSKAYTHRAIIASSLSNGRSKVIDPLICDDTIATIRACRLLGAKIMESPRRLEIIGFEKPSTPDDIIDCGESGSTMRFITPICALADGISILTGGESLRRRPIEPLLKAMRKLGIRCYSARMDGYPPVIVFGGGIRGGKTHIRGDVSSQFISGLLFASPKAERETEIEVTTQLESKPYVNMTIEVLGEHGIRIIRDGFRRFIIPPKQEYKPRDHRIEGDYSSASFILAAAAITDSNIRVDNLKSETLQGDRLIIDILELMGVRVEVGSNYVKVLGVKDKLRGIEINLRDNPDLIPVCAAIAPYAEGKTIIRGVRRLRFKESDRISTITSELRKMGVRISSSGDQIEICRSQTWGAELNAHRDHRIAMACTVTALRAKGETIIHGIECISKSYPKFIDDMKLLGANLEVE